MFNVLNENFRYVERNKRGYRIHIDFCKGKIGESLSGYFLDGGIVGMLEGKIKIQWKE